MVPDAEVLKPSDFLSVRDVRSVFCSNEGTRGGSPDSFGMGTCYQKDQTLIRYLES